MKKHLLTLSFCFIAIIAFAEPFAVRVNGKTDYPTTALEEKDYQDRTQYCAYCVSLQAGDVLTCFDEGKQAEWAITNLDSYGEHEKFAASEKGITCNTAGKYDVYIKLKYEDDIIYIGSASNCPSDPSDPENPENPENPDQPENPTDPADPDQPNTYATAVPEKCPDVMLQAFYWDSNEDKAKHGNTRWTALNEQANEIGAYFDLVWLPPSAKSSGGVGYHPKQYSNQNSAWGTSRELQILIEALHTCNTKVIADIVINHADAQGVGGSWCDMYEQYFGTFGTFAPDVSWICKTDELNSDPKVNTDCKGKASGKADDGYGAEANYAAARDWDHDTEKVREMFRAYLKWMKSEMKYDGWRYDYCKGFHGAHINDYNKAAENYFSMTEYWDGNVNALQNYLNDCDWNTLTLDFATKYTAFNNGIAAGNYANLKGAGLLGAGKSRWAVTFIDSHDSYQRDDNEFCGKGNSMKYPEKILQANAYLISMPGVPCVFYPHWVTFKDNISKMILARQAAGIHSESAVQDEAGSGFYKATIAGTNGSIRLLLGPNSGYNTTPAGYTLADKGTNYAVYYQTNKAVAPRLIITPGSQVFKDNTKGVTVTMKTVGGTENSTIYYTLDGTDPITSATKQIYTEPFTIKETTTLQAYAEAEGVKSKVQSHQYTYKAPQTTPILVRFQKPANWEKVYIYSWTKDAADKVTEYTGSWPGTEITLQDAEGWYYYQFDAALKEVNFIFNAGKDKEQTADLWTDEDVCYAWIAGAEYLVEDCQFTGLQNIELNDKEATRKLLINGQIYILREKQIYTILGTPVK